jgi:hypothetical protein
MLTIAKEGFTETKILIKSYMNKQEIPMNFLQKKNVKSIFVSTRFKINSKHSFAL